MGGRTNLRDRRLREIEVHFCVEGLRKLREEVRASYQNRMELPSCKRLFAHRACRGCRHFGFCESEDQLLDAEAAIERKMGKARPEAEGWSSPEEAGP